MPAWAAPEPEGEGEDEEIEDPPPGIPKRDEGREKQERLKREFEEERLKKRAGSAPVSHFAE